MLGEALDWTSGHQGNRNKGQSPPAAPGFCFEQNWLVAQERGATQGRNWLPWRRMLDAEGE